LAQDAVAPAPDAAMKAQLDKTQAALDAAMRRIGELETKVNTLGGKVDASSKDAASLSAQIKDLEGKAKDTGAKPASDFTFQPYGYIKVDMIYDDTRTAATDQAAFVLPEKPGFGSDKYFSITVRQTRLGVNILGPDIGAGKQSGKVEIDFYAPASIENKPEPMLRSAYWQLTFKTWNVLVGQTWEIMSPLAPNLFNYPYLALSGNPGYRKPMVRYQRTDTVLRDKTLQTDVAVVRGIGSSVFSSSSLDDQASDSGWPVLQSRAGITIPTAVGRPMIVGLSGHLGQEEYDTATSGKGDEYMTYSGNIDWKVPILKELDFNGELWAGRNMDGYMGGIGQGVNTTDAVAVDAIGGWGQFCYKPATLPKWLFTVGAAIDDPDNNDLSAAVGSTVNKSRNATYFTNATYSLSTKTVVGVELSYMKTSYINDYDGGNFRVQTMLQYNF
jgi:hypothetical protein